MTKKELSEVQLRILEYIQTEIQTKGLPPTIREICQMIGLSSTSSVHRHLNILEKQGYIKRDTAKSRYIEIIDQSESMNDLSLNIPVSNEFLSIDDILSHKKTAGVISIPENLVKDISDCYIYCVKNQVLPSITYKEGDLLLVIPKRSYQNSDRILFTDGHELMTGFYSHEQNGQETISVENDPDLLFKLENIIIAGRIIGHFHRF